MKSFKQHLKVKCQDSGFQNLYTYSQERLDVLLDLCSLIKDECLTLESVSLMSGVKFKYLEDLLDKDELLSEDEKSINYIIGKIQNSI